MKTQIYFVLGPTASGKSKFALSLANKLNGEIINADSMQIYNELSILTARPTINDQKNRRIHRKYKTEISKIKNFEFGGRLADYAYYDMDMTISAALNKFNLIKKKIK